jgi:hypothetical protein
MRLTEKVNVNTFLFTRGRNEKLNVNGKTRRRKQNGGCRETKN